MDAQADSAQLRDERRLVTVLFADVCGSTRLGESADPEDVRALLSAFYELARQVVHRSGGRLEKFIGDAVMAVFGLPQAHDDDAARAVAAGLQLRDAVRSASGLGEQLPIRIGVHTGEVVAARDADADDFLVTGDAVNVAARLQQIALPWQVLVSERTVRATRDAFLWEEPSDIEVRGRRQPIRARAASGRNLTEEREVPLVGRTADLALLELAARRAFTERRPYLVTVLAPAGTGKTRLAHEFVRIRLPQLAPAARAVEICCVPQGEEPAISALRSLLAGLLGDAAPPDDASLAAAVAGLVSPQGAVGGERLVQLVMGTLEGSEVLAADRPEVFAAWRSLIDASSQVTPLVLLIDDLHLAPDTLVELLEHAAITLSAAPVLSLVLARPELIDRRPEWGGGRRNSIILGLDPLSDSDAAALVDAEIGRHVPPVVECVVERAGGNPFFVRELVHALDLRSDGDLEQACDADALEQLPDTIQGTLLARMDLLRPDARRVLQLASVFGLRFPHDGIRAIDASLTGELAAALRLLEEHGLVRASVGAQHAFAHALIQETAYGTLTRADRARLHSDAARWLESEAGGLTAGQAEVIAHHWYTAASLATSGADDGEAAARASVWLRRAAELDLRRWAAPEAARHLREAVRVASSEEAPLVQEQLGDVVQAGDDAVAAYEQALRLLGDRGASADDMLRLIGKQLMVHTRTQGALAHRLSESEMERLVSEGERLLPEVSDQRSLARFLIACGFLPFWRAGADTPTDLRELRKREAGVRQGLQLAMQLKDVSLQSCALDSLSGIAQSQGAHRDARQFAEQRLDLGASLDLAERLDALAFRAWESCLLGEYGLAVASADAADSLSHGVTGIVARVHVLSWHAHALARLGRDAEALRAGEALRDAWTETGKGAAGYAIHGFLAALQSARRLESRATPAWEGLIEEACEPLELTSFARMALAVARLDREALLRCVAHPRAFTERAHLLERVLAACLDEGWLPAEALLMRLLAEADRQELRPLQAQLHRGLGLIGASTGELGDALNLAQLMGDAPLADRVAAELEEMSAALHGRPASVAEALRR